MGQAAHRIRSLDTSGHAQQTMQNHKIQYTLIVVSVDTAMKRYGEKG